jgi:hypothetical protein
VRRRGDLVYLLERAQTAKELGPTANGVFSGLLIVAVRYFGYGAAKCRPIERAGGGVVVLGVGQREAAQPAGLED